MLPRRLSRTAMLFGAEKVGRLTSACAAVFGLGGVGAAAAEALARSGVGKLVLVDGDHVEESNLNRQLFALRSTLGLFKTEAASRRINDIAPSASFRSTRCFTCLKAWKASKTTCFWGWTW